MQIPVHNLTGEVTGHIEISDRVFGEPFNESVVHQAMVRQQANARQGTHATKTRGQINASGAKLFRQKGTGNARAGSRRSPLRRGGGITFGPHPRSYTQAMPKKMRRLALRCVLSAKTEEKELIVLESLALEAPKTKQMAEILGALGIKSSALIVTAKPEENVIKSARNLQKIKTLPANILNVVDLLSHRILLMTVEAVRTAEQLWGDKIEEEVNNAAV